MRLALGMLGFALVLLTLSSGCSTEDFTGESIIDLFDGGNNGDNNISTENLEGEWELDLEASTIDDTEGANDLITANLSGTWNVASLETRFLAAFGATIAASTSLEVDNTTFTFRLNTIDTAALDYSIRDEDTVRLRGTVRLEDVQVALSNNGTRLTIVDRAGNTGIFTFRGDRTSIIAYNLQITQTTWLTTITSSDGGIETIIETYEILDDETTIRLTDQENNVREVEAALSNDNDRLTLTFSEADGGGTGIFDRR